MQLETHKFQASFPIPNNPALPVLIYHAVGKSLDMATFFEELFARHGWGGTWRNGIFDYHHFHSNAHEALGIAAGHARVHLGGEGGGIFDIATGDLLILPAGTGHKRISASVDFLVIGAYPKGQENYDICRESAGIKDILERIARVPLPPNDPLYGIDGPLPTLWA